MGAMSNLFIIMLYLIIVTAINLSVVIIYWRNSERVVSIISSMNSTLISSFSRNKKLENKHQHRTCDIVMRSVENFGVGLYAGKLFIPGDVVEHSMGLPLLADPFDKTEVADYYDGFNDTHFLLTYGNSILINHSPTRDGVMLKKSGYDRDDLEISFTSQWTIFPGDQMFIPYGEDDGWFKFRNIEEISPKILLDRDIMHIDDVQFAPGRIPGCRTLLTEYVDGRLLAAANILAGEYIEVSRVLRMPAHTVATSWILEEMVWWKPLDMMTQPFASSTIQLPNTTCIANLNSNETNHEEDCEEVSIENNNEEPRFPESPEDFAILVLGSGALYGHAEVGGIEPNVYYDWWDLSYLSEFEVEPFAKPLNDEASFHRGEYLECSNRMFVSFVAARDIAVGEELVVPLYLDQTYLSSDDRKAKYRYTVPEFASQCL